MIPKICSEIQDEIKSKIKDMYNAKDKSKRLLEIAKRAVEIAIEQDESQAETWINQEQS